MFGPNKCLVEGLVRLDRDNRQTYWTSKHFPSTFQKCFKHSANTAFREHLQLPKHPSDTVHAPSR